MNPGARVLKVESTAPGARCSCWYRPGSRIGAIGDYAAPDSEAAVTLLNRACETLSHAGCTVAVGPMDGTTWHRYRFIVRRGGEPTFFLEPDNPDDWPAHWSSAGFTPCASYFSAVTDDLSIEDPRTSDSLQTLAAAGVTIRPFDASQPEAELRCIHALSSIAFRQNFLFEPISQDEFLVQHRPLLPFVRPELVLMAERDSSLAGFIFAVPDALQARRGEPIDTVVLKTMAVDPSMARMGLGRVLLDLVQRRARQLGFRRAIHALMHSDNFSRAISRRYARPFREYALFSRTLS